MRTRASSLASFFDRNTGTLLLVVGLTGLTASALAVVSEGRLLGKAQLMLALLGAISCAGSLPAVRRSVVALLRRSEQESAGVSAALRRRPALYLGYALAFIPVVSLLEVVYWTHLKLANYRIVQLHYIWQIPIGYALIFSLVGLIFFLIARRSPDRNFLPHLLFTGFFITVASVLPLALKGLYYGAVVLLAGGGAYQLARLADRHAYIWHALAKRAMSTAGVGTLVLAAGFAASPLVAESRAIASLPAISTPRPPNVLLIVLDTVRASSLSLYGYDRRTTPHLDRFASRGLVFDHAFATAPWTLPSHASMFTGRLPHEFRADLTTPLDDEHPVLVEALGLHGYVAAGFVANRIYTGSGSGLARGFAHYEDEYTSIATSLVSTSFVDRFLRASHLRTYFDTLENVGRKNAAAVNDGFLDWLSRQTGERPFFAFLNYFDAHEPYLPPGGFADRFAPKRSDGRPGPGNGFAALTDNEIRGFQDLYDGAIAYMDSQLGRLFDTLDARGLLENTIVIVTADHGEQFGEHNLIDHGNSLYLPLLHVPLVIVYPPRVPAGVHHDEFVSLRHLPATILALADIDNAGPFPGVPLVPTGSSSDRWPPGRTLGPAIAETDRSLDDSLPEWYPSRRGALRSILFDGLHYVRNYGDGREELYDVSSDPHELHDLSDNEPQILQAYRDYLDAELNTADAGQRLRGSREEQPSADLASQGRFVPGGSVQ